MDSSVVTFDRRQIYRPFLERLNPSSPGILGAQRLIVPPLHDPRDTDLPPIHMTFANAAELNRGVQMAVVGGIGSGKTTALWLTAQLLKRHKDAINIFVDLAELTDLNELNPGSILTAIGLGLYKRLKKAERDEQVQAAHERLLKLATGTTEWVGAHEIEEGEYEELVPVHTPGLLKPRFPAIERQVSEVAGLVWEIATPLLAADAQITILIDGLDRLIQPDRFWVFAEQDLRALRGSQISIIVAAPLLLWFDKSRFLHDYFDEVKHIPAAVADPEKSDFLNQILLQRRALDLMDEEQVSEIARSSGGVLRDLITLARTSAEAAYREDQDRISAENVRSAIRQLGRRYLVGLGWAQRQRIGRMIDGEGFSVDNPSNRELLVSRQVLEYFTNGRDTFAVHPALKEVLAESR